MDSSRSHDTRANMNAARGAETPQASPPPPQFLQQYPQHQATRQPGPPRSQPIYPYETQRPAPPPTPQQQRSPQPVVRAKKTSPGRRLLGVLAFFVLTAISVPVHILAVFFVYVEFESPGDTATAVLLVSGAFLASFAALFFTGLIAQLVGGFPGRWRARITFATLSGVIALGIAYFAALTLF